MTKKIFRVYDPADDDEYGSNYDELTDALTTELMPKVQETSGHNSYGWLVDVENFGWQKSRTREPVLIITECGKELLRKILPACECSFKIFNCGDYILIDNAHHDAPCGGELYTIRPAANYVVTYKNHPSNSFLNGVMWYNGWHGSAIDALETACKESISGEYKDIQNKSVHHATGFVAEKNADCIDEWVEVSSDLP